MLGEAKRRVLVAPPVATGTRWLLARATTLELAARIGDQTGGRVSRFLHSDDFVRDYEALQSRGIIFEETPRHEVYGLVAVFTDLHGDHWGLLELVRT